DDLRIDAGDLSALSAADHFTGQRGDRAIPDREDRLETASCELLLTIGADIGRVPLVSPPRRETGHRTRWSRYFPRPRGGTYRPCGPRTPDWSKARESARPTAAVPRLHTAIRAACAEPRAWRPGRKLY